jgi:hypothetical protein
MESGGKFRQSTPLETPTLDRNFLNQASFSNWLAGGVNNFSGTFNASYNLNFKNKHWDWTNRLDLALGYARTNELSDYTKMDDQLGLKTLNRRLELL